MKTFKNMMMAMSAVAMMAASVNTATASPNSWKVIKVESGAYEMSSPSEAASSAEAAGSMNSASSASSASEMSVIEAPCSKLMQYYYENDDNENRLLVYSIEPDGRVTNRIMYSWNEEQQAWNPLSLIHAEYGKKTNSVSHLSWNAKTKRFVNKKTQKYNSADFAGTMIHLPNQAVNVK